MNRVKSSSHRFLLIVALAAMIAAGLMVGLPRSETRIEQPAANARMDEPLTQRKSCIDPTFGVPEYPSYDLPEGVESIQVGDHVWTAKEWKRLSNREKCQIMWGESGPEGKSPYRVYGEVL